MYKIIRLSDTVEVVQEHKNQDDECIAIFYCSYERELSSEMLKAEKRAKHLIEYLKTENKLPF